MARKSGLYALMRRDGGFIAAKDVAALGFEPRPESTEPLFAAHDALDPAAVSRFDQHARVTLFAGFLEEAADWAKRFGLPASSGAAQIASHALTRFGPDTPVHLIGDWSLLDCDHEGNLTLMIAAQRRDPLLFVHKAPHIAVASDLHALRRLSWMADEIDEIGLLGTVGRAPLRLAMASRTMLAGVEEVQPAETVVLKRSGAITRTRVNVFVPQPAWTGSYADARATASALLDDIVSVQLNRSKHSVLLLSGGLDSTLLACAAVRTLHEANRLTTLTSVAPPGSGLRDEAEFAAMAAQSFSLANCQISPPLDTPFYRVPDKLMFGTNMLCINIRHVVSEALVNEAASVGGTQILAGNNGEHSFTMPWPAPITLRSRLGRVRRALRDFGQAPVAFSPCHVRLAPNRLAALPEEMKQIAQQAKAAPPDRRKLLGPMGYRHGVEQALAQSSEIYPGALRLVTPYRDMRLLRLFASFPAEMMRENARNRGMARQLLAGQVPDAIVTRQRGAPAFPASDLMLQQQAPLARDRIPTFRRNDIGEWIDLDWLDAALARTAAFGPASSYDSTEVHSTALFAECMLWWQSGPRSLTD